MSIAKTRSVAQKGCKTNRQTFDHELSVRFPFAISSFRSFIENEI